MKLIQDLGMVKEEGAKRAFRIGVYECPKCLNNFEAKTQNVNVGKIKQCPGCRTSKKQKELKQKLPRTSWSKYDGKREQIFKDLVQKCYFESHKEYPLFGGMGVTIPQKYLDDPHSFISMIPYTTANNKKAGFWSHALGEIHPNDIKLMTLREYKSYILRRMELKPVGGTGVFYEVDKSCYFGYYEYSLLSDFRHKDDFFEMVDDIKAKIRKK